MITWNSDIAIRFCLNRAFLINIHTNEILNASKPAILYLQDQMKTGLDEKIIKTKDFETMIKTLIDKGYLEVK